VGVLLAAVAVFFPPFHLMNAEGHEVGVQYSWIGAPPLAELPEFSVYTDRINIELLRIELVALWFATGSVFVVTMIPLRRNRRELEQRSDEVA